jgi:hypothetical protein
MALSAIRRTLLGSRACAVELSIWIDVRVCGWPSSLSVLRIDTTVLALMNSAPSLASAAEDCWKLQATIWSMHVYWLSGSLWH